VRRGDESRKKNIIWELGKGGWMVDCQCGIISDERRACSLLNEVPMQQGRVVIGIITSGGRM
jgi:hypothetical protein